MDRVFHSQNFRIVLYVFGTIFSLGMVLILYPINTHPEYFSELVDVLFLTLSRGQFALGITMILLPCLMGRCWLLRKFLSFDFWIPLARLTFGAYLLHPIFISFDALNTVRGEFVNTNYGITKYLCWLIVSFLVSLLCTLLVETPFMILEKTFIMDGKKKSKKPKKEEVRSLLCLSIFLILTF